MGLDNGITVRGIKGRVPHYIKDYWANIDTEDEMELAYWRKCWGIRNQILAVLGMNDYSYEKQLDVIDLEVVIELLKCFTKRGYWDEYADSIWTFDEFKDNQKQIIRNLKWLRKYMKRHPKVNVEVKFYDSY
jgi:hypothetical protein